MTERGRVFIEFLATPKQALNSEQGADPLVAGKFEGHPAGRGRHGGQSGIAHPRIMNELIADAGRRPAGRAAQFHRRYLADGSRWPDAPLGLPASP